MSSFQGHRDYFGMYSSKRTPIHEIDARIKLFALLLFTILLFAIPHYGVVFGAVVLLAIACILAQITPDQLMRAAKPAALMLGFVLVANAFVLDGSEAVRLLGPVGVSPAGALRGLFSVSRVLILLGFSLVISATTTATEIADAVSWTILPLRQIGLPTDAFAMIISLSLRFIQITMEELDRIRCAQVARGLDLGSGNLFERVRKWTSVFVPLIVSLLRRAGELADAMRDRSWGVGERTIMGTDWKHKT